MKVVVGCAVEIGGGGAVRCGDGGDGGGKWVDFTKKKKLIGSMSKTD